MLNKKTILLTVSIFILTIALAGCGKSVEQKVAEKYLEGMTGGDVDIQKDGVEIKDKDGNVISAKSGKTLPSGWPKEVTYYKKGKIEQSSYMALPGGTNYAIIIFSNDSVEDILDYYKEEFKDDWKVDMEMNMGDTATLMVSKDKITVTVGIDVEKGEITQTVMVVTE